MQGEMRNESRILGSSNVLSGNNRNGLVFSVHEGMRKDLKVMMAPAGRITETPGCNKLLPERRQKYSIDHEVFMQRKGTLHILRWMNQAAHNAHNKVPLYQVDFADYQSGTAERIGTISGNEHLRSFLGLKIGMHSQVIESAFEGLKEECIANIVDVVLPDDKLKKLGLL
jgi:hypothetical protein